MAMGPFDASDKNSLATPQTFDAAVQFNYEIVFAGQNRFNYDEPDENEIVRLAQQRFVWLARAHPVNEGCIINNFVFVVLLFAAVVRAGIRNTDANEVAFLWIPMYVHVNH
jgi:hypothetical protein